MNMEEQKRPDLPFNEVPPFAHQLRRAVRQCGVSRRNICHAIGISEPTLSRLMGGGSGLSFVTIERPAGYLHLEMCRVPPNGSHRSRV